MRLEKMTGCFVSDLHGKFDKYLKLLDYIRYGHPDVVMLGGDLLPHYSMRRHKDFEHVSNFVQDFLIPQFAALQAEMLEYYPKVYLILGNDDARIEETHILDAEKQYIWTYLHQHRYHFQGYDFYGYAYVPPTPFRLKDWERYDVSRYVDPGCIHPTEGYHSVPPDEDIEFATIEKHLEILTRDAVLSRSIWLFHSPPYQTWLDRAALDGIMVDHIPLDVHVGSIAIQRFIETRQPYITLHGHIHESARLTGKWMQQIGKTYAFNAAHDGAELSLIKIPFHSPGDAERIMI